MPLRRRSTGPDAHTDETMPPRNICSPKETLATRASQEKPFHQIVQRVEDFADGQGDAYTHGLNGNLCALGNGDDAVQPARERGGSERSGEGAGRCFFSRLVEMSRPRQGNRDRNYRGDQPFTPGVW